MGVRSASRTGYYLYAAKRPKLRGGVEKKQETPRPVLIGSDIQRIGGAGGYAGECSRNARVLCGLDGYQVFQRPFSNRQLYG
jgi:hypothetical protein